MTGIKMINMAGSWLGFGLIVSQSLHCESNPGPLENPTGCKKGKLVQEELIKNKYAIIIKYADRGEQKYEKRIGGKL